ncbi:hypothetical protein BDR26DRAFT_849392 [Obelidium mucronatum]|nr:hypothetical protein BDR26DRAFT_849392 [Obelidium mucronatum]
MEHDITATSHFNHSVGQNLYKYWSSDGSVPLHPFVVATSNWINQECQYYNGSDMNSFHKWGHYSQVIAPQSNLIGCSTFTCLNNGGILVACDYFGAGNVVLDGKISIGGGY